MKIGAAALLHLASFLSLFEASDHLTTSPVPCAFSVLCFDLFYLRIRKMYQHFEFSITMNQDIIYAM